jgi:O-methyltransferase involved in polyketide biosynthesis
VPVDFEVGSSWLERLAIASFDRRQPAVVSSTGVGLYLTKDAITATLRACLSTAEEEAERCRYGVEWEIAR